MASCGSCTSFPSASMRVTVPASGLVTHAASAEAATDPGRSARGTVALTSPDAGSRMPIELGAICKLPPDLRATNAIGAATTANATTAATTFHGLRGAGVGAVDRTNGAIASAVSRSSERTATTWTGWSSPFISFWPRSVNRTPSTRLARWTISRLASTSPARASEQSRRRDVQGPAAVAALDGHRLAGVQADPDGQRQRGICDRLVDEPVLQGHGAADRPARRTEDDQGLVTAELDHMPPVILDHRPCHLGEAFRQVCGLFIPVVLREPRPAANIGDQESVDVGVSAGVRLGLRSTARLVYRRLPAIRRDTHALSINPCRPRREGGHEGAVPS